MCTSSDEWLMADGFPARRRRTVCSECEGLEDQETQLPGQTVALSLHAGGGPSTPVT